MSLRSVFHKVVHKASHAASKAEKKAVSKGKKAVSKGKKAVSKGVTKEIKKVTKAIEQGGQKALNDIKLLSSNSKTKLKKTYNRREPCALATGFVLIDIGFVIYGALGFIPSNDEDELILGKAMLREMGDLPKNEFEAEVRELAEADTAFKKAKAIMTLGGRIDKAGMFSKWPKIFADQMTTAEWIGTGVGAVATIALWFGSDGAAGVAKVLLEACAVEQVVIDGISACKICQWTPVDLLLKKQS